uniref:Uncharacterized protein n=1 Tax=Romanomermis culicivorax TaxID=13658 RepID=A0A915J7B2_ROMCU
MTTVRKNCLRSVPPKKAIPVLGITQCGKTKVHNRCVMHPIILRKCSPPEMGGKPCYDDNQTPFVFANQTPLSFGERCDCRGEFDHLQNMICNADLNGKTQCGYMVDSTENSFGDLADDFYGCCLPDTPPGSRAMCIVGNCINPFFQ